jgi:acyl-CoA thioester hydrolase
MEGYPFASHIRVRFADTDAQGVAHNSNYFIWFEVARVEFLERFAGGYQRLRDQGIESLVLESHAHFKSPAFFDDRLLVHARCHAVRGARFRFDYVVERDGTLLADGWTLHGTVDAKTLRPTRTPEWLSASLLSAGAPTSSSSASSTTASSSS